MPRYVYNNEHLKLVQREYQQGRMSLNQIADVIGVTASQLRKQMSKWRKKGFVIVKKEILPVGGITHGRKGHKYIKTETGFQRIGAWEKAQPRLKKDKSTQPVPKQYAVRVKRIITSAIRRPSKPIEEEPKVSKPNFRTFPIYIPEKKMTVYVREGKNIDEVRQKYLTT